MFEKYIYFKIVLSSCALSAGTDRGEGGVGVGQAQYYVTASLFRNSRANYTKTALILSSSLSIFNPGSISIFYDVCPTWRAVLASNPGSPLNRGEPTRGTRT